ncbi:PKD domain-containing protein [Fodinibius salsisoli]|uniref:PKD domain-containing protein n=1 Tax=Fodinibius salsisoli TaxID=2820877 RepID=A0ABT3PR09_9BACT|nr:PKD domain-containing protein [Fodinibius salsisoli]MCW9708290.1 PKD domain-containing protein [Fodinibius salsisoli]
MLQHSFRLLKVGVCLLFIGMGPLNSYNAVAQEPETPTVELYVISTPTITGDSTNLIAYLRPEYDGATYNFHLGNGEETGWGDSPRLSYVYNNAGQYEAFVEVKPTPNFNPIRSNPVTVEVINLPEVEVSLRADKTDAEVNETIQFTGRASNETVNLVIYYGDDNAGNFNGPAVEYSYPQAGTYTVQLNAYVGNKFLGRDTITINVGEPDLGTPNLSLDASESMVGAGNPILFTAQLLEPSGQELTYEVNFGNNTATYVDAAQQTEHSYPDPGRYRVYATARNPNGEIVARSNALTVSVIEVRLNADKNVIRQGESVEFTGSINPAVDNATYNFVVGDSVFSRPQPTFDYVFRQEGEHEINLLTSIEGRSFSSNPYSITVHPGFNLSLEPDPSEAKTGTAIHFTAAGIPAGVDAEYNFHFGDGEESGWTPKSEATYTYDQKGSYDVFVEARLSPGETFQSTIVPINIEGFPYWILIAGALVILGAGSYFLVRGRIPKKENKPRSPGSISTTVKPHIDLGQQEVSSHGGLEIKSELRLKPVKDIGAQSIKNTGNLIIQEQRDYDEST